MPGQDGLGPHDDEHRFPVGPRARQPRPEPTVRLNESYASWLGPLQHLQLMAQGQDLEMERGARSRHTAEGEKQRDQDGQHREESLSVTAGKFKNANTYGVFSNGNRRGRDR
jgi:hypothetical protein